MNWVTWENVGVDRIACAWLIRLRIDEKAVFRFVPESNIPVSALGEAFDIPGVRFSHHRGRATFHSLLEAYRLDDPVLQRIARIVDEADTVQEVMLEPIAPGLDAICRGLRRTSRDDLEALERGRGVFDALYAVLEEGEV